MMEGQVYSDFVMLWLLCHQSRVEADNPEECWLERWSQTAREQGTRALDNLRDGVEKAIKILGSGFISYPSNFYLREKLRKGMLSKDDYFKQLLRLIYRLIFLFVAEDRDLLFSPHAKKESKEFYMNYYSASRLRHLAERMRGTKHCDLYWGLRIVMQKLGANRGCEALGLSVLGSFLWSEDAIPDLMRSNISNIDLLKAIRSLCFMVDGKILRAVDYKNLGSEELGSIYESLLELHPEINIEAATFELKTVSGHERKTTGSYYTPSSLINCLLDSALEPVIKEALKKDNPEEALLSLKVCDPACGSGHFLIAAAHRLAKRLAALRTGDEEPSPQALRTALRDVIGHCIYGVDINPMAVELCKVALWMEALEPGKPLSFLDHRILCGNSLLGATPKLLKAGIPDSAFTPIEGDDREYCRIYKRRNRDERRGFMNLFDAALKPWEQLGNLATAMVNLEEIDDDSIEGIKTKQKRYKDFVTSNGYLFGKFLADAWCASFVWKKKQSDDLPYPITEEVFRNIEKDPHSVPSWLKEEVERLAKQYQFFHWHIMFPDVFRVPQEGEEPENEHTGWSGGFDVVLGNPPWGLIQIDEIEFFSGKNDEIVNSRTRSSRHRAIERLKESEVELYLQYKSYCRKIDGQRRFAADSGVYNLSAVGRVNTYKLFLELGWYLVNKSGRLGMVVPSGIVTDDFSIPFFREMVQTESIDRLYDFENRKYFPSVDSRFKFVLITLRSRFSDRKATQMTAVFYARDISEVNEKSRQISLKKYDFEIFNPNTFACPIFKNKTDFEICKDIYQRIPIFVEEKENEVNKLWGVQFGRIYNMGHEGDKFTEKDKINFKNNTDWLPLYEGKMFSFYNHRAASVIYVPTNPDRPFQPVDTDILNLNDPNYKISSQFYLPVSEFEERIKLLWGQKWLIGVKNITSPTNERTIIGSILPWGPTSYSVRVIIGKSLSAVESSCLLSVFNSYILDWVTRQFLGGLNLQDNITKQLPIVSPDVFSNKTSWEKSITLGEWITIRVLELTFTSWDLQPFAKDCGYDGPPFKWDEERRFLLRCELDAAYFHLYLGTDEEWKDKGSKGLLEYFPSPRDAANYIMETFPIVKRKDMGKYGEYRTKRVILEIYDEMTEAMRTGKPYQTRLDPPPADPRVAHRPKENE